MAVQAIHSCFYRVCHAAMLDNFSRTVAAMYEVAELAPVEACAGRILQSINNLIPHDGALLGFGSFDLAENLVGKFLTESACCSNCDPHLLKDYAMSSEGGWIKQAFCDDLRRPITFCGGKPFQCSGLADLLVPAGKYGRWILLLFGTSKRPGMSAMWIVLYRFADPSFTRLSARYLHALWPHIQRSMEVNRKTLLRRESLAAATHGFAVVSPHYRVEVSESSFDILMRMEWPAWTGVILPKCTWSRLGNGIEYAGSRIRLGVTSHGVCSLCHVAMQSRAGTLTKAERIVATAYGAGQSNKEIARDLNLSVSTIRTHVAHVFEKLEVHKRADLARCLGDRSY